jgi:hypothetical protein
MAHAMSEKLRPELDSGDEDDRSSLLGGAVLKYGCLLFAVATVATAIFALLQYLLFDRR